MLSISFSEIVIICIVALLLLGKKEIPEIVSFLVKAFKKVKAYKLKFEGYVDKISKETQLDEINKAFTKTIVGDDGKEYIAYNLDLIKPDILDTKDIANNEREEPRASEESANKES